MLHLRLFLFSFRKTAPGAERKSGNPTRKVFADGTGTSSGRSPQSHRPQPYLSVPIAKPLRTTPTDNSAESWRSSAPPARSGPAAGSGPEFPRGAGIPPLQKDDRIWGMCMLRHNAASTMVQNSIPLATIAAILGHAGTRTTDIYGNTAGPFRERRGPAVWLFAL